MVSEYTGLNFHEVEELEYFTYLGYLRDAFIFTMNKTESGQEYLDNAWQLEQTEPDRASLRQHFGRKEAPSDG